MSEVETVDLAWSIGPRANTVKVLRACRLSLRISRQLLQAAQLHEQEVMSSRSWRVTRPLRWISDRVSALRGRDGGIS